MAGSPFALFSQYFQFPGRRPGWPVLAAAGAAAAGCSALYLPFGIIVFAGFVYLALILRQPASTPLPMAADTVCAPIDGRITAVSHDRATGRTVVRMCPDWLDSHIACAPAAAMTDQSLWLDGTFSRFDADNHPPQSNARLEQVFITAGGHRIEVVHYGAPVTRLIQSFVEEGRAVRHGTPISLGLLRGYIDVIFHSPAPPPIVAGMRCIAAQTVILAGR